VSAWLALAWWLLGTIVQWASAALALQRRPALPPRHQPSDFSIVAPMAGAADASEDFLRQLVGLERAGAEILICVSSEDDGAVAPLRRHWQSLAGGPPPLLIGADATFNPKMNNVRKGLEAARRRVVALCDAGVAIDADRLREGAAALSPEVGLVLVLKVGNAPEGLAARLEWSWVNGHQSRFLLAADRLGMAVAAGGIILIANETLQRIGNWKAFNRWIADDYSVVRTVREHGMTTVLGPRLTHWHIGRRDWRPVWRRQVRWSQTRLRLPVWPLMALEPLAGAMITGAAGAFGLAGLGAGAGMICAFVAVHLLSWVLAEKWYVGGRGQDYGPAAALAGLAREVLAPFLMLRSLFGRTVDWRGNDLAGGWQRVGADAARHLSGGNRS
jgi:hypothetical protein